MFESWLTVIAVTRNACGHHSRVRNKQNTIQPAIPNSPAGEWITLPTDSMRAYFDICIIKYFLNVISPNNDHHHEHPLQAAKQRSCGYNMIPHPYRSPKGDWHINYDVEDDSRSRFAEPREGEVMLIPQLCSFGACSGFLRVTCPLGTRRCTKLRITDADR